MDSAAIPGERTINTQKRERPPFECIALTLQGGGALGAYQAGVYQALDEAGIRPDWVAGISIGAINAALIAGNPPERRVARLREFWNIVSANPLIGQTADHLGHFVKGPVRQLVNFASGQTAVMAGAPGFFMPRLLPPALAVPGSTAATSWYDTAPLKHTLERLVDFDRINANEIRLSVGAVNVRTGNFVYFDTTTHKLSPAHIMASGALPPGFPAVEIDGEHYWDGGVVSNTPLQWVLQFGPRRDTLVFEVDLWSARGAMPRTLIDVETRRKDITYSSRTRDNVDRFKETQRLRHAVARLYEILPPDVQARSEAKALRHFADQKIYSIVHLISRLRDYESCAKDYAFTRLGVADHWRTGYTDTVRALKDPRALARPLNGDGVATFDFIAPALQNRHLNEEESHESA